MYWFNYFGNISLHAVTEFEFKKDVVFKQKVFKEWLQWHPARRWKLAWVRYAYMMFHVHPELIQECDPLILAFISCVRISECDDGIPTHL